jgi:predicted ATP-grasp superfamily ATP-dependent carboligase
LLIVGASARAAAWSALRAGIEPWWADLFGDVDLRRCCPGAVFAPADYPEGLAALVKRAPAGPWMYTGGLENRPALVQRLARGRVLWGNDAGVLALVRSPQTLTALLRRAGIPCPAVREIPPADGGGRWLVKPLGSAGGTAIHFWEGTQAPPARRPQYFQEFVEGEPCSAVFVGDGRQARLLGATRQLVGEDWLHARPFHYCGSLGPRQLRPTVRQQLERIGHVLAGGTGLHGLFGVDGVVHDGRFWPVEVNPRYTASIEVLEYAQSIRSLDWHRRVFEPAAPALSMPLQSEPRTFVGKAIWFARKTLIFPEDGPWRVSLRGPYDVAELPEFADIPERGQTIAAGRPVVTLFAEGRCEAECLEGLRGKAEDLDRWLAES